MTWTQVLYAILWTAMVGMLATGASDSGGRLFLRVEWPIFWALFAWGEGVGLFLAVEVIWR